MKKLVLLAVLVLSVSIARAQDYSVVLGGSLEPDSVPYAAGSFSLDVTPNAGEDIFSFTAQARGPQPAGLERFLYSYTVSAKRRVAQKGRFSLYGDVGGGGAISTSAASGMFVTSGSIEFAVNKNLSFVLAGGMTTSPVDGGTRPKAGLYLRLTP